MKVCQAAAEAILDVQFDVERLAEESPLCMCAIGFHGSNALHHADVEHVLRVKMAGMMCLLKRQ